MRLFILGLLITITSQIASAAYIVSMRTVELTADQAAPRDGKSKLSAEDIPESALVVTSVSVRAEPDTKFSTEVTIGDRTIHFEGRLKPQPDGSFSMPIRMTDTKTESSGLAAAPSSTTQLVQTHLTVQAGKKVLMSVLVSGKGHSRATILTLTASP